MNALTSFFASIDTQQLIGRGLNLWGDNLQRRSKISWKQAALFYVGVNALGYLASRFRQEEDDRGYQANHQPIWAPPREVYAPVWMANNAAMTWALHRILSKPWWWPGRNQLLTLQGFIWLDYATFGLVYFRLKSPVLCYLWTQADALLATASFKVAYRNDHKLAWSYAPLMAWTWYASTIAAYQALYNADPLLHTPALLTHPQPALDKEERPELEDVDHP